MKNISYVFILIAFACGPNYKPIQSQEEQMDENTRIDLNFKGLEYVKLETITYQDSFNILFPSFDTLRILSLEFYENAYQNPWALDGYLKAKQEYENSPLYLKDINKEMLEWHEKVLRVDTTRHGKAVRSFKTDCEDTYLGFAKKLLTKYETTPQKIIGEKVKVTYSILNPALNATQTITNIYLLSAELDSVIFKYDNKTSKECLVEFYQNSNIAANKQNLSGIKCCKNLPY